MNSLVAIYYDFCKPASKVLVRAECCLTNYYTTVVIILLDAKRLSEKFSEDLVMA